MADLIKIGANSLYNWQQALTTTGHNIANANTEGYSQQKVNLGTEKSRSIGNAYIGQGAEIVGIERSYNSFLTSQVRDFTSTNSQYETFVQFSSRIDDILSNSENSLNTSIQKFFNATSDVASNPSSLPERQVLIGEANSLVERQQSFNKLLQDLNSEINNALELTVNDINSIATSISKVNQQIISANNGQGSAPNDLLDERDRLVEELSTKISVTTIEQNDGAFNVLIGNGQPLVIGAQPTLLDTRFNLFDASQLEVGVQGLGGNQSSKFIKGGELQGLLDFRARVLNPAQRQLGVISLGLSETINNEHSIGLDLNGDLGTNFFTSASINTSSSSLNTGTSAPVVTLLDSTEVRASEYAVDFNGTQWQFTRLSDNTSVVGAGPLVLDGMSVDVSAGVPASGDNFLINPGRDSAINFDLVISDPRKIAAASPINSNSNINNVGASSLSDLVVNPTNTLPLAGPITLTFNPDALGVGVPGFDVLGGPGGTIAYDPVTESAGKSFNFAGVGLSFTITDVPVNGDSFTLNNNTGAAGDNRNMLAIGDLQYQPLLNGSTDTYQDYFGSLVAKIGVTSSQANSNLAVESTLFKQASDYRDSVSGVNLDEEAANLLRYQQAYQASAQLIKVADELFQVLINSIR